VQLFFQQSYVIDKRITPRFIGYEKIDLWIGIIIVLVGAVAMVAFAAATFAGTPEAGNFTDAGGVAAGLARYVGHTPSVLFALALLDASIIGNRCGVARDRLCGGRPAAAASFAAPQAGRGARDVPVYAGLIAGGAGLVLLRGRRWG